MPNILKFPAKVHAAKNFLKSFYDAGGSDRIYIGLSSAGGEWVDPLSPPLPINSYDEEQLFWQNLIGVGQVSQANDTDLVTLRKTWVSGSTYVVFNENAATGSGTFDTNAGRNFYICNTETNPKVYKLLVAGPGTSINEPIHSNPTGITEADGYDWAYLYNIGSGEDVAANQLTLTWMPVPSTAQAYANGLITVLGDLALGDGSTGFPLGQIFQVYATTGNTNGVTMNLDTNNTWVEWQADQELGTFYVACSLAFPDSAGTGAKIPNVAYRQVALLRNPKNATGIRLSSQWEGTDLEAFATLTRSVVMTLDNRTTITRAIGQTEIIRIILEF